MKHIRNERGIALVTALMLTLISLAIVLSLLYIVTQGTKVSAVHKRYKTSLEASYGGVEVFTKEVIPMVLQGTSLSTLIMTANPSTASPCFISKLSNAPSSWGAVCGPDSRTTDPKVQPDLMLTLQGSGLQPNFTVYAKIVDTMPGNSDTSGIDMLDSGAGVAYGSSGVSPKHMPATYRIEVQGEREKNPLEKANLSILYAY